VLWCAPHSVCPGTQSEPALAHLFIRDDTGKPSWNDKYFSLCFAAPEARQYMVALVERLIREYDVDGVKLDLFNGVQARQCTCADHRHDTNSLLQGLQWLLRDIHATAIRLKPDFIIELKQNYSTPFIGRYGTLVRAGDAPYCTEGNFLRTAHIQSWTAAAENDYMTVTPHDSPADTAILIIKMMAVGVPTYSNDFTRVPESHQRILRHYHAWYAETLPLFRGRRTPLDGDLRVWKAAAGDRAAFFLLNDAEIVELGAEREVEILNGTGRTACLLRSPLPRTFHARIYAPDGSRVEEVTTPAARLAPLAVPAGGRAHLIATVET